MIFLLTIRLVAESIERSTLLRAKKNSFLGISEELANISVERNYWDCYLIDIVIFACNLKDVRLYPLCIFAL